MMSIAYEESCCRKDDEDQDANQEEIPAFHKPGMNLIVLIRHAISLSPWLSVMDDHRSFRIAGAVK
jgi:hypothetical protein